MFWDLIPRTVYCRFFGVVDGDEKVTAVAGGDGLIGGESNGSGGGSLFLSLG